jgi:hypothetical protein
MPLEDVVPHFIRKDFITHCSFWSSSLRSMRLLWFWDLWPEHLENTMCGTYIVV